MTELNRRHLLKVLSVSAAGTAAACNTQEPENILPYVVADDDFIPGRPTLYASTCMECAHGCGLVARNVNGRLTTLKGNPADPVSQGGLCSKGHAALQSTYGVDRLTQTAIGGSKATVADVGAFIAKQSGNKVVISATQTGTVGDILSGIDGVTYLKYEATQPEGEIEVARTLTGGLPTYNLADADLIVSLDAEYLASYGNNVAYTKQLTAAKKKAGYQGTVHVSSLFTQTAANSDTWVPVKPNGIAAAALALAKIIADQKGVADKFGSLLSGADAAKLASDADVSLEKLQSIAKSIAAAKTPVVLCGTSAENGVVAHAATAALNDAIGAVGSRVAYDRQPKLSTKSEVIAALASAGVVVAVDTDVRYLFGDAVKGKIVALATAKNDTTEKSDAVVAIRSAMESWNNVRVDGVTKLTQPTMQPIDGELKIETTELVSAVAQIATALGAQGLSDDAQALVRATYEKAVGSTDEQTWLDTVGAGFYSVSAAASAESENANTGQATDEAGAVGWGNAPAYAAATAGDLFVQVYTSSKFHDGRTADRPWLHEQPDSLTTVVWDSWAEVHPKTVEKLGAKEGDTIKLTSANGAIEVPIVTHIGARPDVIGVASGLGKSVGTYTQNVGENAYKLLNGNGVAIVSVKATVTKVAKPDLVKTQLVDTQDDRGVAQSVDTDGKALDEPAYHGGYENKYPLHPHPEYRWGMSVDLDSCTGCGSCIVACDSENNVPMVGIQTNFPLPGTDGTNKQVGKGLLQAGREMHWMRIERYFEAQDTDTPDVRFVPAMCQQCTNAPCESVCPVYATMHTTDGVNAMVYNRCVGTRYCANNCPYKQRRLNWMTYEWPEPQLMQLNPEVTVRTKGVMEKCNFCYQRIRNSTMDARIEKRRVQDGEITTACQDTCPADAIMFGDVQDDNTAVSKAIDAGSDYKILEYLNTRPGVSYLKKVIRKPVQG